MAESIRNVLVFCVLACAAFEGAGIASAATRAQPAQPIDFSAQNLEVDYKNSTMTFRKVRIAQGAVAITAEQGQANGTSIDFDDSLWVFRGLVKITMEQGTLNSDEAQVTFAKKTLSKAVANGRPASFEQRIAKSGKVAQGHADLIDYDVTKGIVHLTKNAWLTDGQNEIRGESLKYNVLAQVIIADAAEQGSQRVHIIITPPANPKP